MGYITIKNNIMKYLGLLLLLGLTLSGCVEKNYGVEFNNDLVPYFETFKQEAAKRGVEFDNEKEKIEGYIQVITTEGGIAGLCNPDTDRNRSVIVDSRVWNTADEATREYIIFHELGHCFLKRSHIEDDAVRRDTTDACESMMFSGGYRLEGSSCLDLFLKNNSTERREELLDELFRK